jgi:4-hydroxybenzoate polyprenyltransferase
MTEEALRAEASTGSLAPREGVAPAQVSLLAQLRHLFRSLRPRQWTKNSIVFMALLFSIGEDWKPSDPSWAPMLGWTALTFALFCMVSSAEYLVNDVADMESDRQHPEKRRRPIAAGLLPARTAVVWAIALWAGALAIAFGLSAQITWHVGVALAGYILLMVAYTFVLKHIVLIDMMAIGAGFVLRAMTGALAIDVPISPWLYVVTALGAFFLIIHKRRAELTLLEAGASSHRKILEEYSPELLDQIASLVTASTLIAYGLYTFTAETLPENHSMMLTIPFVFYGLLRYLYLVHQRHEGGSPEEVLLRDWPLILDIALWMVTSAVVLAAYRS